MNDVRVQEVLERAVAGQEYPGVVAEIRDGTQQHFVTAGVAQISATGEPAPKRTGSVSAASPRPSPQR